MPITHTGARVTVRVVLTPQLPDGRRFARLDGAEEVIVLCQEGTVMDRDAATELQELMQDGFDSEMYDQNRGGATEEPPQPQTVS